MVSIVIGVSILIVTTIKHLKDPYLKTPFKTLPIYGRIFCRSERWNAVPHYEVRWTLGDKCTIQHVFDYGWIEIQAFTLEEMSD